MILPPPYLQSFHANYNPEVVRLENVGYVKPLPYYPPKELVYGTNPVTVEPPTLYLTPSTINGGVVIENFSPLTMLPAAGIELLFGVIVINVFLDFLISFLTNELFRYIQ